MDNIKVKVSNQEVGSLFYEEDRDIYGFNYANDVCKPISLTMPYRPSTYHRVKHLHPIFDMNMPEGYLFEMLKNHLSKQYGVTTAGSGLPCCSYDKLPINRPDVAEIDAAELFVLDMGEPVKIYDLARRMVELSGYRVKNEAHPEGDIEIKITGLRPGEKLYEELLIGDNPMPTMHPRIMKAHEEFIPWSELQPQLHTLQIAAENNDVEMIRGLLQRLVKGYQPEEEIADWVYREQTA